MRAHPPSLVVAIALCWLIASLGTAPPAAAVEEAAAEEELQEEAPSGDAGAQGAGEDPLAAAEEATPEAPAEAEPEDMAGKAGGQDEKIEELYVTATKREESLQDVPISMAALDASFLEASGVTQFGQISEYVPNLTINPVTDTRGTVMRIRGIGSIGNNAGIDPSVGLFIDGVYQGRAGMSVGDLLDIERVEVLRGPQGTLYGKNTAAGLINIISKRPIYEWETVAEGVFGNYANYEGRASVNVPIVDEHVAARLSGYRVVRDGFDKRLNVAGREFEEGSGKPILPDPAEDDRFTFVDGRVNDANKWGTKGRVVFDLMDNLSFLVTADYSYEDTVCCVADIITFEGDPTLSDFVRFQNLAKYKVPWTPTRDLNGTGIPLPEGDGFDRVVAANDDPWNKVGIGGVALDATYEVPDMPVIGDSSVNLIGAWRTYSSDSRFDGDFSYYIGNRWATAVDLDQYSVELRLTSPGGELVDYQTGLYFYHQDMHTVDELNFGWDVIQLFPAFGGPTSNMGDNTHKTYSYAGFGQLTLNPIEKLSLTGGLRVTYEKKTRVGSQTSAAWKEVDGVWQWVPGVLDIPPVIGPAVYADNERSVTNVSGMANLRYFPTEDIMLYASFATGFKSGGFNQLRVLVGTSTEFDDEESMNFEAGFKTSWFERMLTLNATGFYTDYDKFQAQLFDGTSVSVRNAGSLESYGVEAELVLVPAPGLVLGSSLGFNIAEYTDFPNGEQTAAQRWEATGGFPIQCTELEACVQDLTGKRLDSAPNWSVSSFAQYDFPLPGLPVELFLRAEYSFNSMRFLAQDLDPNLKQDSTHIVNLRSGFRVEESWGGWELAGWVRNLSDEKWNVVGFDVPTMNGFAGINAPPRQFGLTVRVNF